MLIWDEAVDLAQWYTHDDSAATETKLKILMNLGYKELLAAFVTEQTERVQTALTVAGQRAYTLPPDYLIMNDVTVTVGTTKYSPTLEDSLDYWNALTAQDQQAAYPTRAFIRPKFGVRGAEIEFDPIPSTAGYTITISYGATDRDMATDKYTAGTVTVTGGSRTLTGSGTTFTAAMVGRYFRAGGESSDGQWYRISAFNSTTDLTLETTYEGSTQAGLSYEIAQAFALPEEMQILPMHYALCEYFSRQGNGERSKEYYEKFLRGLALANNNYATKDKNQIINLGGRQIKLGALDYPMHFPQGGATE